MYYDREFPDISELKQFLLWGNMYKCFKCGHSQATTNLNMVDDMCSFLQGGTHKSALIIRENLVSTEIGHQ